MPLSRDQFLLQRRRLRAVMDYMHLHLEDESLRLDTLAEVAHLSRFHFERLYAEKVGESPMATLRRLRLLHAWQRLQGGTARSITEVAVQAGYGSVAAFSRAFARVFGQAPSRLLSQPASSAYPELEIITMPAVPVVRTPFSGPASEVFEAGHDVNWALHRTGTRHWRHWTVHPEEWVNPEHYPDRQVKMWHCIPVPSFAHPVTGAERGFLPAGVYARFALIGPQRLDISAMRTRVAAETNWIAIPELTLRHYPKVPHYTPVTERIEHFYLRVTR